MPLRLLLAVLTTCMGITFPAHGTPLELQRIHEMRSLAYLATTNLMVFYNLDATPFDPDNAKNYRDSLTQLAQIATQDSDSVVNNELRKIEALTTQLDALPRDREHVRTVAIPYQRLLNPLYQAQQRIDNDLEQRYEALARNSTDGWQQGVNALSIEHSRMMQQYAMLTFPSLAYLNIEDPTLALIDGRIQHGFEQLERLHVKHAAELQKLAVNYTFIRKKLVNQPRPWIPVRTTFYLSRNITALSGLALSAH